MDRVPAENEDEEQREVEEVAMDVLHDQWKVTFAPVALARLADGTGRRVGPERLVVGAAIVVTRQTKSTGRPEDQHGRRDPDRQPRGLGAEPGVIHRTGHRRRAE